MKTRRDHVWSILNNDKDPRYGLFSGFINILILISVGVLLYETLVPKVDPALHQLLMALDKVILVIFALEYAARLWVLRPWRPTLVKMTRGQVFKAWLLSRLRFILSPWGLIDLLALLPLVPFLRSLRVIRVLRLFRSITLFRYNNLIHMLVGAFRDNALLFGVAFGFVLTCIVISSAMFFFAEYGANDNVKTVSDTLWWSIVTISTVGYGDITPNTLGGRLIGAALMISGMFTVAIFAGVISSTLVGQLMPLRQEQIRMSQLADHIIIAGWNDNVPMLLEQLEAAFRDETPQILIFAPVDRPDTLRANYIFVHGDPTRESEYDKVRLKFARTVILVADDSLGAQRSAAKDATTVLTLFTIRRLEQRFAHERVQPLHICAEILAPENVDHATTAGADEVLATALMGHSIMAHMASNPGVSYVLKDLLMATQTNVYTSPLPVGVIEGQVLPFAKLQEVVRKRHGVLVIGIKRRGQLHMNPDPELGVLLADDIIYLGERQLQR